ncbi:unnamed protein product [Amoebophrya sp. A25]|nr:unnamed protein product [Amoebophrya sp. A25]|eukprot:GSA25T00002610001.1
MSRFLKACAVAAISVEGVKLQPAPTAEQLERFLKKITPPYPLKCSETPVALLHEACGSDVKPETLTGEMTPAKFKKFAKRMASELTKASLAELHETFNKKNIEYTQEVCCPKTCC